jgi:sugar phosphate isomerase/epimerase
MLGAEEYRAAVSLQAEYLVHVHVKDLSVKDAPPAATSDAVEALPDEAKPTTSRIVGEGILPWREILVELHRCGYAGWLSIEYERRWYPDLLPPAEIGMKAGADTLRRILGELN